ncbi:hypothetical protein [Vibrio brasiliensis]|uniref:hypothetical protein n=1 Tax=Vibrio brasiliensis TaxID=170652 RepID=UPI001EFD47CD|nr:hypothetical protein [Vibrio brasiliensis]
MTVSDAAQAAERLKKAITTELASVEKRRSVGGHFRKQHGLASEQDRMMAINRIHRILANPDNQLSDIVEPTVIATIGDAGFRITVNYTFNGRPESTTL